ncbi:MAG TPA: hypothetical protein VJ867_15995 [Gemmatimonadaceae bacterium]|nr:hypothetical protein [Gemmatimonadaceae bacterium]
MSPDRGVTPGSLVVNPFAPSWTVQDSSMLFPVGQAVCYVGVVSGWVCGQVTKKNYGSRVRDPKTRTNDKYVIGMTVVNMKVRLGDSGAPVFSEGLAAMQRLARIVVATDGLNGYFSEYAYIAYVLLYRDQQAICGANPSCFIQFSVSNPSASYYDPPPIDDGGGDPCARIVCPTLRGDSLRLVAIPATIDSAEQLVAGVRAINASTADITVTSGGCGVHVSLYRVGDTTAAWDSDRQHSCCVRPCARTHASPRPDIGISPSASRSRSCDARASLLARIRWRCGSSVPPGPSSAPAR